MNEVAEHCQHTGCENQATKSAELVRSDERILLCDHHYEVRVLPGAPDDVRVKPGARAI
jgi:hypothetical protein